MCCLIVKISVFIRTIYWFLIDYRWKSFPASVFLNGKIQRWKYEKQCWQRAFLRCVKCDLLLTMYNTTQQGATPASPLPVALTRLQFLSPMCLQFLLPLHLRYQHPRPVPSQHLLFLCFMLSPSRSWVTCWVFHPWGSYVPWSWSGGSSIPGFFDGSWAQDLLILELSANPWTLCFHSSIFLILEQAIWQRSCAFNSILPLFSCCACAYASSLSGSETWLGKRLQARGPEEPPNFLKILLKWNY